MSNYSIFKERYKVSLAKTLPRLTAQPKYWNIRIL